MGDDSRHGHAVLLVGCGLTAMGCIAGPPLLAALLTGAGINLATAALHDQSRLWLTRRELNHDLARACADAADDALRVLKKQWSRSFYPGLARSHPEQAALSIEQFDLLRAEFRKVLLETPPAESGSAVLETVRGDAAVAQSMFERELRARLYGHSDQLVSYLSRELPAAWAEHLLEQLKDPSDGGTRAWRATQIALFSDLRTQVGVSATAADERLRRYLDDQLAALRAGVATPLTERLLVLELCARSVVARLDRIDETLGSVRANTDALVQMMGTMLDSFGARLATDRRMPAAIKGYLKQVRDEAAREAEERLRPIIERLVSLNQRHVAVADPRPLPRGCPFSVASWSSRSEDQRSYVDYWLTEAGSLAFLAFDAIASTPTVGAVRAAARVLSRTSSSPPAILAGVNEALLDLSTGPGSFTTAFLAVLDPAGHAECFSAGYGDLAAYLDRPGGELRRCMSQTIPLGIDDDLAGDEPVRFGLSPGGWLVAVSDGVTEQFLPDRSMLGPDRVWAAVARSSAAEDPDSLLEAVLSELELVQAGGREAFQRAVIAAVRFDPCGAALREPNPEARAEEGGTSLRSVAS